MESGSGIRYLKRSEIDIEKWDRLVKNSANGFLYAQSFYLDALVEWGGLVLDDYQFIMPLPHRKKYGITYIYVAPFIGQLGIIGIDPVLSSLTDDFLRAVPKHFIKADLLMNEQNASATEPSLDTVLRTNYIIPLDKDYEYLRSNYSEDATKNIRRTLKWGLTPCTNISVDKIIKLYRTAYGEKNTHISQKDYTHFKMLAGQCMVKGNGFTIGIQDRNKKLLAAAFFGSDNKRIYYILGAPSPEGRKANATHLLIDEVIKKYAGTSYVFDFEGSDIPNVSKFYLKFGPLTKHYDLVRIDRTPTWARGLRKKFMGK
jgi:hypothetical protein